MINSLTGAEIMLDKAIKDYEAAEAKAKNSINGIGT